MNVLDLEVQRERRAELLREAENKRVVGRRRLGNKARLFSMFASLLALVR